MVLGAMALAVAPARAANAPIYKCFDNHLNLVYTDLPCKDGERLDIRAGDADPAAVARLERSLDQLDESAAQRLRDERRVAEERALAPSFPEAGAPQAATESADYGYGYGYGYGYWAYPYNRPFKHPRPHKPHVRPHPEPGMRHFISKF